MKRFVAAACLLAAHCTGCSALDLKGVSLGMTQEELQLAFPTGTKPGRPDEGQSWCYGKVAACQVNVGTLGGIPNRLQVSFLDGRVAHVYSGNLSPTNFEQVAEALKTKFGTPTTSSVGQVQNRMGGKFDNPTYVWKLPDGELHAAKFMPGAPTLDNAQVEIDSPEWIEKQRDEKSKRDADL